MSKPCRPDIQRYPIWIACCLSTTQRHVSRCSLAASVYSENVSGTTPVEILQVIPHRVAEIRTVLVPPLFELRPALIVKYGQLALSVIMN